MRNLTARERAKRMFWGYPARKDIVNVVEAALLAHGAQIRREERVLLKKHGHHLLDCESFTHSGAWGVGTGKPCTCGLDAALEDSNG